MNQPSTPPSPQPRVHELRCSRIRFVASTELLERTPAPGSLGALVAREAAYADSLAAALARQGALDPPWPPGGGLLNHFWRLYLAADPDRVSASRAWRLFVPLRLSIPVGGARPGGRQAPLRVTAEGIAARLQIEAFLFPHGFALVTRGKIGGDLALEEAVDAVLRLDDKIGLRLFEDGRVSPQTYKLPLLEARLVETLGRMIGWQQSDKSRRTPPFVITTVISGRVVGPTREVAAGSSIHLALEGFCSRDEGWRDLDPAPALDARSVLPTKGRAAGNLLYARDRGRAVWQPSAFGRQSGHRTKLGCYHRNLMQLTVQIESLLALMALAASDLEAGGDFASARMESLADSAAKLLGRLYGKTPGTYHSASTCRQVDVPGRREAVDRVRRHLGLAPLST